jgi:hypothetical protein
MGYLAAIGSVVQAGQQQQAADNNAYALKKEGMQSSNLYNLGYAEQIKRNTMANAAGAAAAVESGGGVGGSTKGVLDQNALEASMQALNIKYQGLIKREGYNSQAGFDQSAASQEETGTLLKGSASLLQNYYKPSYPTASGS